MKLFAKMTALLGITALFAGAAFAQTPPPAPSMTPAAPAATRVKGYTRTTKTGKVVQVRGYKRKSPIMMPKMTAIQGYTRHTKTGKTVAVKGYTRKVPMGTMKK